MMAFREKYRNVDVLVVDDVHLLANKERTQRSSSTRSTRSSTRKQIVLSSDSPPKDIPTLQDRLVSRFKWGMVSEIEAPCYETRMAIVKRNSERGALLPDEVVRFIAENIEENVASLEGRDAALRLARPSRPSPSPSRWPSSASPGSSRCAAAHPPWTTSSAGHRALSGEALGPAVQAAHQDDRLPPPGGDVLAELTRHSLEEIGGFFGGRDHTTVMYAVDKIRTRIDEDDEFGADVQRFMEQLMGRG